MINKCSFLLILAVLRQVQAQSDTTVVETTAPMDVFVSSSADACPANSELLTHADCQAAAQVLGLNYWGSSPSAPRGCWKYTNPVNGVVHVFGNVNDGTSIQADDIAPICKNVVPATEPPTMEPTLMPTIDAFVSSSADACPASSELLTHVDCRAAAQSLGLNYWGSSPSAPSGCWKYTNPVNGVVHVFANVNDGTSIQADDIAPICRSVDPLTETPTLEPTLMPTMDPTLMQPVTAGSSCDSLGSSDEFKFTFKRTCGDDGWSSTCASGFALYDLNGVKIDLAALNPIVTDTGFWRSGAHSYIGEEILEGVGLAYCSEPIQCTASDVLDDEIVTIKLDREVAFSSFDLQQVDKLAYRPEEFTLEIVNASGDYETVLVSDFDLGNREIRNFANTCACDSLGSTEEFKFTFKRTCDDGWSSTCVSGFALYDLSGVKIDLAALNPEVTDTGFWRSGAHSYIGEEILEGVGLGYCSEPIQCTDSDVLDDEIVTIRLDTTVAFSSFDLQQVDKLSYRPEEFTLEALNANGDYDVVLVSDFDLGNREIRNFANTCACDSLGSTHEFKFTFKRTCEDGWSSTCMDGFALYDVSGVKLDLAALNPVVTDTGFWRSGAHSYIGEEILEGVGLGYCSEPIQCTDSDVLDDEIVTITLDTPVAFSSFDLQQVDKLSYRPEEFTLESLNANGDYDVVLVSDFDLGNREIRNFANTCVDENCDECVSEFAANGGCPCMLDDQCDESSYIPPGCGSDACGMRAWEYCNASDSPTMEPTLSPGCALQQEAIHVTDNTDVGRQWFPIVRKLADNRLVVAWDDLGTSDNMFRVYGSDLVPQTGATSFGRSLTMQDTWGYQRESLRALPSGGFVMLVTGADVGAQFLNGRFEVKIFDASLNEIHATVYGMQLFGEPSRAIMEPKIALFDSVDEGFLVTFRIGNCGMTWSCHAAQIFDATATPVGEWFYVDGRVRGGDESSPVMLNLEGGPWSGHVTGSVSLANGNVLLIHAGQNAESYGTTTASIWNQQGQMVKAHFLLPDVVANRVGQSDAYAHAALLSDGNVVVVWMRIQRENADNTGRDQRQLVFQILDQDGNKIGANQQSYGPMESSGDAQITIQGYPMVAATEGKFTILSYTTTAVFTRTFSNDGTPAGPIVNDLEDLSNSVVSRAVIEYGVTDYVIAIQSGRVDGISDTQDGVFLIGKSCAPSMEPTASPTMNPSLTPTMEPTALPTQTPSLTPTMEPTLSPTVTPTSPPTESPTNAPGTCEKQGQCVNSNGGAVFATMTARIAMTKVQCIETFEACADAAGGSFRTSTNTCQIFGDGALPECTQVRGWQPGNALDQSTGPITSTTGSAAPWADVTCFSRDLCAPPVCEMAGQCQNSHFNAIFPTMTAQQVLTKEECVEAFRACGDASAASYRPATHTCQVFGNGALPTCAAVSGWQPGNAFDRSSGPVTTTTGNIAPWNGVTCFSENLCDSIVRLELTAQGWTQADFDANRDTLSATLANTLGLSSSQVQVSLRNLGWLRRNLQQSLTIYARIKAQDEQMATVNSNIGRVTSDLGVQFSPVQFDMVDTETKSVQEAQASATICPAGTIERTGASFDGSWVTYTETIEECLTACDLQTPNHGQLPPRDCNAIMWSPTVRAGTKGQCWRFENATPELPTRHSDYTFCERAGVEGDILESGLECNPGNAITTEDECKKYAAALGIMFSWVGIVHAPGGCYWHHNTGMSGDQITNIGFNSDLNDNGSGWGGVGRVCKKGDSDIFVANGQRSCPARSETLDIQDCRDAAGTLGINFWGSSPSAPIGCWKYVNPVNGATHVFSNNIENPEPSRIQWGDIEPICKRTAEDSNALTLLGAGRCKHDGTIVPLSGYTLRTPKDECLAACEVDADCIAAMPAYNYYCQLFKTTDVRYVDDFASNYQTQWECYAKSIPDQIVTMQMRAQGMTAAQFAAQEQSLAASVANSLGVPAGRVELSLTPFQRRALNTDDDDGLDIFARVRALESEMESITVKTSDPEALAQELSFGEVTFEVTSTETQAFEIEESATDQEVITETKSEGVSTTIFIVGTLVFLVFGFGLGMATHLCSSKEVESADADLECGEKRIPGNTSLPELKREVSLQAVVQTPDTPSNRGTLGEHSNSLRM